MSAGFEPKKATHVNRHRISSAAVPKECCIRPTAYAAAALCCGCTLPACPHAQLVVQAAVKPACVPDELDKWRHALHVIPHRASMLECSPLHGR
jgi:hypothetical protein